MPASYGVHRPSSRPVYITSEIEVQVIGVQEIEVKRVALQKIGVKQIVVQEIGIGAPLFEARVAFPGGVSGAADVFTAATVGNVAAFSKSVALPSEETELQEIRAREIWAKQVRGQRMSSKLRSR